MSTTFTKDVNQGARIAVEHYLTKLGVVRDFADTAGVEHQRLDAFLNGAVELEPKEALALPDIFRALNTAETLEGNEFVMHLRDRPRSLEDALAEEWQG